MDRIRIGRFIAGERKKKGYTRKQLAEKLGISEKTVSEWECGNGFPEVSLLLPLCGELGITVNDLLSGEPVSGEDYREKAEDNMVEMIGEREANRKQFMLTFVLGGVSIVSFITLLIVVSVYTDAIPQPVKAILTGVACAIFAVGFLAMIEGQRIIGYYLCTKCGKTFIPKFWPHMFGFSTGAKRRLKCPYCGEKSWCRKVMARGTDPAGAGESRGNG